MAVPFETAFTPTALASAAWKGDAERARELLAASADVDETDHNGETALMYACVSDHLNDHAPIIRLLIEAGADLEKASNAGVTPLKRASIKRRDACIRLLIDEGASALGIPELENRLLGAAGEGDTECVRTLLAAGADINEVDENGRTALMMASDYGHAPVVRLLIEAGADLEKADKGGDTALEIACRERSFDCIHLLLEAGAVLDEENEDV